MTVSKIKIELICEDKMSGAFRQASSNVNGFNRTMSSLGSGNSLNSLNRQMMNLNVSMNGLYGTMVKLSGAWKALGTIGNMLRLSFGGAFDYAKAFETNAVGISGILSSMTTLDNKTLEWNKSMEISKEIMRKLRIEALQTAATSTDLIEVFRGLLGPGLGAGMTIDEIMKFTTVGVNAVKSIGLPTNQYLQELRGLEQGGIRASSSTLATALGLKDEDIKRARESSEGLFKFLMKRLEGFRLATDATATTMAGQAEIIKEAWLSIASAGSEEVLNTYSQALEKISNIMLVRNSKTGLLEVNPEAIETIKQAAGYLDYAVNSAMTLGSKFAENGVFIAAALASLHFIPKIINSIAGKFLDIFELSGQINNALSQERNITEEVHQSTLSLLNEKEKVTRKTIAEKDAVQKVDDLVAKILAKHKLNYTGWVDKWRDAYDKLGFSVQEANQKIEHMLKMATSGSADERALAWEMDKVVDAQLQHKDALEKSNTQMSKWLGRIGTGLEIAGRFSGALSGIATAMLMMSDENDKSTREMSKWLYTADACISSASGLVIATKAVVDGWKDLAATAPGAIAALKGVGLAALFAGGAYAIAQMQPEDYRDDTPLPENDQPYLDVFGGALLSNRQIDINKQQSKADARKKFLEDQEKLAAMRKEAQAYHKVQNDMDRLQLMFKRGEEASTPKSTGGGSTKTVADVAQDYEILMDSIRKTTDALNTQGSAYDTTLNKATDQIDKWNKKLLKMKESGLLSDEDAQNAVNAMKTYYSNMFTEAEKAQDKQNLKLIKSYTERARLTMELGRGGQAEEYKLINDSLQMEKEFYEKKLADKSLEIEQRIQYEKDYAATVKAIRANDMYDFKSSWQATLQELSQQQINYGEHIKAVFSSIQTAGVNLLTSTESFGQKIKTFFSDVASSILAEMAKIIMKGLITHAILSVIGMGHSKGYKIAQADLQADLDGVLAKLNINKKATGGYTSGWTIVGEKGPELVNFTNPGRVYTAQQTANALKTNGNGNLNIKFDIKNETGTAMQAEQTGSSFDGESYVIGVVLKAMANNTNGMRSVVKGLANA